MLSLWLCRLPTMLEFHKTLVQNSLYIPIDSFFMIPFSETIGINTTNHQRKNWMRYLVHLQKEATNGGQRGVVDFLDQVTNLSSSLLKCHILTITNIDLSIGLCRETHKFGNKLPIFVGILPLA